MLYLRKRGATWYVRGTVKIGKKTETISEHSTGAVEKEIAESYKAKLQKDAENAILFGAKTRSLTVTFSEAALKFLDQRDLHTSDKSRVSQLEQYFGDHALADIDDAAFKDFCKTIIPKSAPNTRERVRITLNAIFAAASVEKPTIPSLADDKVRVRYLPLKRAAELVIAYPKHVRPIALVAGDCGLRASENLLMLAGQCDPDWGDHGAFTIPNPKNGYDRFVPWTVAVREAMLPILKDKKDGDRLWLNRYGEPYSDTRKEGGNPLSSSHGSACKRAGVVDFRWHDWRHHYACWALAPIARGGKGWLPPELQMRGGWRDLESLQRYAQFIEHKGSKSDDRAAA